MLCIPTAGRRKQLFHVIFTQPGAHLLEIPCMLSSKPSAQREEDGTFSRSSPAGGRREEGHKRGLRRKFCEMGGGSQ